MVFGVMIYVPWMDYVPWIMMTDGLKCNYK